MSEHITGAEGQIWADQESNRVVVRFLDPQTGEPEVELRLPPEVALSFAFTLTTTAYELPQE